MAKIEMNKRKQKQGIKHCSDKNRDNELKDRGTHHKNSTNDVKDFENSL